MKVRKRNKRTIISQQKYHYCFLEYALTSDNLEFDSLSEKICDYLYGIKGIWYMCSYNGDIEKNFIVLDKTVLNINICREKDNKNGLNISQNWLSKKEPEITKNLESLGCRVITVGYTPYSKSFCG